MPGAVRLLASTGAGQNRHRALAWNERGSQ